MIARFALHPAAPAKLILSAAIVAVIPSAASAAEPITGDWVTQEGDAIVTIAKCGTSTCGRISKYLVPPPDGSDQRDIYNPDPAKKNRRLLGLPVLSEFAQEKMQWRGRIYDPKSGKSYRSIVRRKNANTIEVKGCISFFCQTQIWKKAQ